MKNIISVLIIIITADLGHAQTVDFDLISYNGLNFNTSKAEILEVLGQPERIYKPNHDCGFLSADTQHSEYLTLDYGTIKFTGNDKESFLLEQINFETNDSITLKYGNYDLTHQTGLTKLMEIFGKELEKHFDRNTTKSMVIFRKEGDDGIRITLKNGKLIRFEYWSPC
ncbi:hypothetical protein ACJD0Z_02200 [Flavobacteriaceae bacterium M23B6Z8]